MPSVVGEEHDDRVVQRVAQDRQDADDGRRSHLELQQRVHADGQRDVVDEGDQGCDRHPRPLRQWKWVVPQYS